MNVAHGGERTGRTLTLRPRSFEEAQTKACLDEEEATTRRPPFEVVGEGIELDRRVVHAHGSYDDGHAMQMTVIIRCRWLQMIGPARRIMNHLERVQGGRRATEAMWGGTSRSQSIEDLLLLPCAIPRRTDTNQMSV